MSLDYCRPKKLLIGWLPKGDCLLSSLYIDQGTLCSREVFSRSLIVYVHMDLGAVL